MKDLKVLFVTPSFYPATYWGGPLYSTKELCDSMAATQTVELRVVTTDSNGPSRLEKIDFEGFPSEAHSGYEICYYRRNWSVSFSARLLANLPSMIRWAEVVHLTGVYSSPTIPTLAICKLLNKPVVWSPRGSLQRWAYSSRPFTKHLWEITCNALCDKERVTLHLTSDKEMDESLQRINRASVAVIPNGVEVGAEPRNGSKGNPKSLRLMYLGRLDRIKGIENLLAALKVCDSSVSLSICGDGGNGYAENLKALTERLGIVKQVRFEGHVTGEEKRKCFANSDVFVMPSFSESFGLSAAEALSHGLPVIVSKGTPWSDVERVGCGLWVDNDPQSLADAIRRIRKMPLDEMGRRGREWMSREFSWDVVAEKMLRVYRDLMCCNTERDQQR